MSKPFDIIIHFYQVMYNNLPSTHEFFCAVYFTNPETPDHIMNDLNLAMTSNLSISQDPNGLRSFGDAFQIAHL